MCQKVGTLQVRCQMMKIQWKVIGNVFVDCMKHNQDDVGTVKYV